MIDGLVSGRLYGNAEPRTDKAGKPFTVAKVRASTAEGETFFVNVIAFDRAVCAALQNLHEGDSVALTGSMAPRVWTDKQGHPRPALDMVALRLLAFGPEAGDTGR
jgi:single-stranded DNA-binding protein